MGIVGSVELLTKAVAERKWLTKQQQQYADALCTMPEYFSDRRLDLWESSVRDCCPAEKPDSEVTKILSSVFELGRSNLYSQFDRLASEAALAKVKAEFKQAGIPMPEGLNVRRW